MMPILVKGDDISSGTKANTRHGQLQPAKGSIGQRTDIFHTTLCLLHLVHQLSYPKLFFLV